jgi:RHS repeat-associated protein
VAFVSITFFRILEVYNFTAYVNPYTVINNGNQMSKHIYVGTQRIMSKLCDAGAMADPTTATKATYTGSTLKYADKYTTLTNTVKARYDSLGVAYNGVDNKGIGFYKASSSTPSGAGGSYYYHSDHLGSANYITDETGSVSQHLEYIPYGETFVDERYSTWHSPYKFNGKERDEETGLTYYGARYFDGNGWLSVDPLAHKYPNVGSYVYCLGNPVKYVDKDGKIPSPSEGAIMAEHVYSGKAGDKLQGGWKMQRVYKQEGNSSFRGGLYSRTNKDGKTEYTFATAGTYFENTERGRKSIAEDIKQPFGQSSDMKVSIATAKQISQQVGDAELTFVGHSKGGAEAAGNALATNRNALIFNPAAINAEAYGLDTKSYTGADEHGMTTFVVGGDFLNDVNSGLGAKPIGNFVMLPQQSNNPIENHKMEAVKKGLNQNEKK